MTDSSEQLLKTPLHDLHVELGARMVPFAGYDMPVQYPDGVLKEHRHTRAAAGLFDVSHMGQAVLVANEGEDAAALVEELCPGSIAELKPGRVRYSMLLADDGGIMDDLMVTRPAAPLPGVPAGDMLYLVVNAACKDGDLAHIRSRIEGRGELIELADRALIALQGPQAIDALNAHVPGVADMVFMQSGLFEWQGESLFISRSGYTGEDGAEISVPASKAEELVKALLADERVKPIGLGARDSLRLEAGLPLYGHDIDLKTSPVEAALTFAIGKRRRAEKGFPGADRILDELENGTARKRVGLLLKGRAPAREGAEVIDGSGNVVGVVTSGTFSPSREEPIAMAYVDSGLSELGTKLAVKVRKNELEAEVCAMPFVAHQYKR